MLKEDFQSLSKRSRLAGGLMALRIKLLTLLRKTINLLIKQTLIWLL
jgi:hypothetical protein